MKKIGLFLASILVFVVSANAQWTTSGSNIYWNVSGGKLGIGTTAPAYNVDIQGSSNPTLRISNNSAPSSSILETYASGVNGFLQSDITPAVGVRTGSRNNYDFYLATNNTNRMIIKGTGTTVGYVGINTTSPAYQLDVNGIINATGIYVNGAPFSGGGGSSPWTLSGSNIYFNATGGLVGIGTTTPAYNLDVNGTTNSQSMIVGNLKIAAGGSAGSGKLLTSDAAGNVVWASPAWTIAGSNVSLSSFATGNVGIGTSSPDAKLTVNGTIHTKEVKVDLSVPGPDYVFEKEYNLLSLEDIKNYIDHNKHLPEVPSAKEMEKNGMHLGDMSMLLLKKIEELTLHMIELKKENEILKSRIESIAKEK